MAPRKPNPRIKKSGNAGNSGGTKEEIDELRARLKSQKEQQQQEAQQSGGASAAKTATVVAGGKGMPLLPLPLPKAS